MMISLIQMKMMIMILTRKRIKIKIKINKAYKSRKRFKKVQHTKKKNLKTKNNHYKIYLVEFQFKQHKIRIKDLKQHIIKTSKIKLQIAKFHTQNKKRQKMK